MCPHEPSPWFVSPRIVALVRVPTNHTRSDKSSKKVFRTRVRRKNTQQQTTAGNQNNFHTTLRNAQLRFFAGCISPPWFVSPRTISALIKAQKRYSVQECDARMLNSTPLSATKIIFKPSCAICSCTFLWASVSVPMKSSPWFVSPRTIPARIKAQKRYSVQECDARMLNSTLLLATKIISTPPCAMCSYASLLAASSWPVNPFFTTHTHRYALPAYLHKEQRISRLPYLRI